MITSIKKMFSIICLVCLLFCLSSCSLLFENVNNQQNNEGLKDDVIKVSSVADFLDIAKNPKSKFELTNDIDFQGAEVELDCRFKGTLDGKGYKIRNINNVTIKRTGLAGSQITTSSIFKEIGEGSTIKNLVFVECRLDIRFDHVQHYSQSINLALLSGVNNGAIENCKFSNCSVSLTSTNTGGDLKFAMVTGSNSGKITNLTIDYSSKMTVTNGSSIGDSSYLVKNAFITSFNSGSVENCILNKTSINSYNCGGVVYTNNGLVNNIAVIDQKIYGSIYDYRFTKTMRNIGGVVALNHNELKNCYVFGSSIDVDNSGFRSNWDTLNSSVGGICAQNTHDAILKHCYFEGKIYAKLGHTSSSSKPSTSNSYLAGICGNNVDDLLSNFSDCIVSGDGYGSLTTGNYLGNRYVDLLSKAIIFNSFERRLDVSTIVQFGSEQHADLYNVQTNTVTYSSGDNNTSTKSWLDYLIYKGFILNDNYVVKNIYPILNCNIGYNNDEDNYQEKVASSFAREKSLNSPYLF